MALKRGIILIALFSILTCLSANQIQPLDDITVDVSFNDGLILNQGSISTVTITIKNPAPGRLKLEFTGIQFEWQPENVYIYGDKSEQTVILGQNEQRQYTIAFNVPSETSSGTYKAFIAVSYALEDSNGWSSRHQIIEIQPGISVVQLVTVIETKIVTVVKSATPSPSSASNDQTLVVAAISISLLVILLISGYLLKRREKGRIKL